MLEIKVSDEALAAARKAYAAGRDEIHPDQLGDAMRAAHDPALGLDRSVCLRNMVEALCRHDDGTNHDYEIAADFIEREFGGAS